jgi:hypothetical protein
MVKPAAGKAAEVRRFFISNSIAIWPIIFSHWLNARIEVTIVPGRTAGFLV